MTITILEAVERFDTQVDDHHDQQSTIPVTAGLARQGDVAIIPATMVRNLGTAMTPVPKTGIPVVRGESGGNTHLLLADGPVFFDWDSRDSQEQLALGTLTIPEGSTGFLAHPEHAFLGIAPGSYQIRRQREQADIIRLVAD